MALIKFTTPTQPGGSTAGLTLYKQGSSFGARSRAYPVRVRSTAHTAAMNAIAVLSVAWEFPLTDADRIGWGAYAFNSPLTDAYGNPRYIKGYAHYMRSNRPRYLSGIARVDAPPTTDGIPTYTLPTINTDFTARIITITIDTTDAWANQDNAYMFAWAGVARSAAVTRPTETYQPAGYISGDSAGIASIWELPFPSAIPINPVSLWVRTSISLADGRLSGE